MLCFSVVQIIFAALVVEIVKVVEVGRAIFQKIVEFVPECLLICSRWFLVVLTSVQHDLSCFTWFSLFSRSVRLRHTVKVGFWLR